MQKLRPHEFVEESLASLRSWCGSMACGLQPLAIVRAVSIFLIFTIHLLSNAEELYEYPAESTSTIERQIDTGHLILANSVDATAVWLDRWLGGDDIDYSSRQSQARLRQTSIWEEREPYDNSVDFRLKLVLPKTERRLKLFINSETDEFGVRDPIASQAERENEEAGVALQIAGFDLGITQTDYRVGLQSGGKLRTSVRINYRQPFNERFQLKGLNELYWLDQFGFGNRLRTDLDYLISIQQLLRWRSLFDFNEVDRGVPWETAFEWSKAGGDNKILTLYLRALGQTRPVHWVEAYGPGVIYRRSIGRPWFFVEGETRLFWKKSDLGEDRKPTAAFILRFEMVFDEETSEFWH